MLNKIAHCGKHGLLQAGHMCAAQRRGNQVDVAFIVDVTIF